MLGRFVAVSLVLGLAACAPQLNRQQSITWDAYKACQAEGPSTLLERVNEQGGWYIFGREGEVFKVNQCMIRYRDEVRRAGRTTPSTGPALTAATAQELVRFAYLTHEPPKSGTRLSSAALGNMPPRRSEFAVGAPITFFFGLNNANSLFDGQIIWTDGKGAVVRRSIRPLEQGSGTSEWLWWTDTLPPFDGMEAGNWSVEFLLNNVSVGHYPFSVVPQR
jgi:hypothetical protein